MISTNGSLCSWLHVGPSPHVLVLLLHPAQLGIAVLVGHLEQNDQEVVRCVIAVQYLLHYVEGEWTDLLDGVDGYLVNQTPLLPLFDEVVVNFPSTEKHLQ